MYQLPKDSVQVTCLGASTLLCAFSPNRLYGQQGICAYNNCSSNQPPLTSYYLLKEMIDKHPNSLSVAIIDTAPLVKKGRSFDSYVWSERVVVNMRPSLNKLQLMWDISQEDPSYDFFSHLVPLLSYHDRWDDLTSDDFQKLVSLEVNGFAYGQLIDDRAFTSNRSLGRAGKYTSGNVKAITSEINHDTKELEELRNKKTAGSMARTIDLCKQKGIKVLLLKTPTSTWTDKLHDSVRLFADTYEVDFLDMNLPEVWNQCNLSYDDDYRDTKHVNLLGSQKVTDYLGKYLKDHYGNDLRPAQNAEEAFSQEDAEEYQRAVQSAELRGLTSLTSYAAHLDEDRYTVLVATKGNVGGVLDNNTRDSIAALGLQKLARITEGESYVGVRNKGKCVKESQAAKGKSATITGTYAQGEIDVSVPHMQKDAVFYDSLRLESSAGKATINVDDNDVCLNNEGINIVVYDDELGLLVDSSCFGQGGARIA